MFRKINSKREKQYFAAVFALIGILYAATKNSALCFFSLIILQLLSYVFFETP